MSKEELADRIFDHYLALKTPKIELQQTSAIEKSRRRCLDASLPRGSTLVSAMLSCRSAPGR